MRFKIKSEPEKVMEFLKTNRPLKVGDILTSPDGFSVKAFADAHPELVELVDGDFKTEHNKMFKKSDVTKYGSK